MCGQVVSLATSASAMHKDCWCNAHRLLVHTLRPLVCIHLHTSSCAYIYTHHLHISSTHIIYRYHAYVHTHTPMEAYVHTHAPMEAYVHTHTLMQWSYMCTHTHQCSGLICAHTHTNAVISTVPRAIKLTLHPTMTRLSLNTADISPGHVPK